MWECVWGRDEESKRLGVVKWCEKKRTAFVALLLLLGEGERAVAEEKKESGCEAQRNHRVG